jgi:hypothetical protein
LFLKAIFLAGSEENGKGNFRIKCQPGGNVILENK